MGVVGSYKNLIVWQKSRKLVLDVYKLTELYPDKERFNLIQHTRKTSISIPSNIAEGWCLNTPKLYKKHIRIAYGSIGELETQLLLALDLGYIDVIEYNKIEVLMIEIMKMLYTMLRK